MSGEVKPEGLSPEGGFWEAWAAYVDHVHPRTSQVAPCPICVSAETPTAGCEEGKRLYGVYRLAKLGTKKAIPAA